ncbi:unnamed protein product [Ceratitis capitata]|uniref:(Mediterranean fruit fly) hypothetical protein n=1 Tax=Ceratitis capitata TaxID=7213 RepID=A0A811USY2_CERCA|nr:unnamed protein product [Ceratitis capitata]
MQSSQPSQTLSSHRLQNPPYHPEICTVKLHLLPDKFDEVTYSIVINAKHILSSLLIQLENESVVMEKLEFNFGRPELLIKVHIQKIQDFPPVYEGRFEQVLGLSNKSPFTKSNAIGVASFEAVCFRTI